MLPNCTGYATGRFAEIIGKPKCEFLGNTNACNYIKLARKQGLQITNRPEVGGVMVWSGGSGGYGHVAIVEMDLGNRILTSESEYYGKAFTTYQRFGKEWASGCYWMGSSYKYLGCIKNPALQEEDMTKAETEALIRAMFPQQFLDAMADYLAKQAALPAENAIERVKAAGLMVGDPSGNFRAQSPIKREEAAQILANMLPDR